MGRIITISYTELNAGGGVPKFNRDLHAAFPDRECKHFCWTDATSVDFPWPEWIRARTLNQYLLSSRQIRRDDVIVADGFWAMGLEHLPFAISHSHGIWGHITHDPIGQIPENIELHNAQVTFRDRWTKFKKSFTAVSDFIAEQMRLQWGFQVDRVIDNGVDLEIYHPHSREMVLNDLLIIHGINDPGNLNKGWNHIELLKKAQLGAHILSLDEAHRLFEERSGRIWTKAEVLSQADLVVHPSGFEGNSMFVAEALACGVPFVGYNVGFVWKLWRDADGPCTTIGEILDRKDRSPQATLDACQRVLERLGQEQPLSSGPNMGSSAYMTAVNDLSIGKFRESWREYVTEVESRGA